MKARLAVLALAGPALAAAGAWGPSCPAIAASPAPHQVAPGHQPQANPAVLGLALSGTGASLQPPTSPTDKPYDPDCHALIDRGFRGECVVVAAPTGTVAGVVEKEPNPTPRVHPGRGSGRLGGAVGSAKKTSSGGQERDLVWLRQGQTWALALVRVFQNAGLSSLVWADDIERDGDPKLVFVVRSAHSGFGTELDLVEGTGQVVLYRFLGDGFADVPAAGGLVTYVPGRSERNGPPNAYDQTLIGYSSGSWRVYSEQYVPDGSALQQHRAAFWDSQAVPAK